MNGRTPQEIAEARQLFEKEYEEHVGHNCKSEALSGQAIMVLDWLDGKDNGIEYEIDIQRKLKEQDQSLSA